MVYVYEGPFMIRAHKIRLHPTPEQANYCARAAGTSRFVWKWALGEWNRQYEAGEKPTAFRLKKQFNEIRREQFPWTWEVTKNASDQPFLDLGRRLLPSLRAGLAARASRAKSEANQASISPMISLSLVIIASGFPSSAGSTWQRICVSKAA